MLVSLSRLIAVANDFALPIIVQVRFTNGEAWVRFFFYSRWRFDITSIYKNGILANKSCRYVNFLTCLYRSLWMIIRRSNKNVKFSIDLATKNTCRFYSVSLPQRTLVEKRNRAPKRDCAPAVESYALTTRSFSLSFSSLTLLLKNLNNNNVLFV